MPENLKGAKVLSNKGNYVSDFELDAVSKMSIYSFLIQKDHQPVPD